MESCAIANVDDYHANLTAKTTANKGNNTSVNVFF